MKITIDASYLVGSSTDVDIPVDSWDQVKDCYVKWDVFHYTLDNVEWKEVPLGDLSLGNIDFKRPSSLSVYNEEGDELFSD
jgi:hypothetical protein